MGGRSPEEDARPQVVVEPSLLTAAAVALGLLLALMANGRPIGSAETRGAERAAAALVERSVREAPSGASAGAGPPLSPLFAAPVFAATRAALVLDETGAALAGKAAASLFSALAAGVLFVAMGRRRPEEEAAVAAVVFALGTGVWAASQALWPQPLAVLFLSLAVLWILRSRDQPLWGDRAGLPLGLAVAAHPADATLAAVLALALAARRPKRIPLLALWALPGVAVVAYQWSRHTASSFAALGRLEEPWGAGQLGLLASPGKGLLIFTPVAIAAVAGLVSSLRHGDRWLAATLGAGVLAHWTFVGRLTGWPGGESWGPRLMTDALPLLFVFLPEGLDVLGRLGRLLAALSVAVQAMGAFAYDHRWERLHPASAAPGHAELWSLEESPIVLHATERVVILALPAVREGKAFLREQRMVLFGRTGSRVAFGREGPTVKGAEETLGNVHLLQGARTREGRLELRSGGDALFLRVAPGARVRRLELRIIGRGHGILAVGERTFWSPPRVKSYPMAGAFRFVHPYEFAGSGGPDLTIGLRGPGDADIEWIALVPPGDPDSPIEVP